MDIIDKTVIIANSISVIIYYAIIRHSKKDWYHKNIESITLLRNVLFVPIVLMMIGFVPCILALVYIFYVIIVGTTNLIRGMRFFQDIETFGFLNND